MLKDVQACVVGKVFKPNRKELLALNRTLSEYSGLVRWYLRFNSKSKSFLHENCYERAKELFSLNTALIQTARDKSVEILKSFEKTRKETKNTSKTCHRCGHVAQVKGRIFKSPKCGMEYDRDLNACINIAHRVMSSMGWGRCEPSEPADEEIGVKPTLNAGSPQAFSRG